MTSSLVFALILIAGIAAIGAGLLGGLVALLRRPVGHHDVKA